MLDIQHFPKDKYLRNYELEPINKQVRQWPLRLIRSNASTYIPVWKPPAVADKPSQNPLLQPLIWGRNLLQLPKATEVIERLTPNWPEVLIKRRDPSYLSGHWQDYRLVERASVLHHKLRDLVRCFVLPPEFQAITQKNAVMVHVRRLWDCDQNQQVIRHQHPQIPLPISYYQDAISQVKSMRPDAFFYLFGDDPKWSQTHLMPLVHQQGIVITPSTATIWRDLILMSLCQFHILSNSTFSWWGAFMASLRQPEDRPSDRIVAPTPWFNNPAVPVPEHFGVVVPESWLSIPC